MDADEMAAILALMGQHGQSAASGEGVVFRSEASAKSFSDHYDKDVVKIGAGWLAKNRATSAGPMPTKEGDVVVHHRHELFLVWTVTADPSQSPDPNIAPVQVWSRTEAEEAARRWTAETGGQIFWLQAASSGWDFQTEPLPTLEDEGRREEVLLHPGARAPRWTSGDELG